ncbi:DUF4249 domain-containing protein [Segetibacter koreensis]|uniref:DUF4249 domain-containing protein n=1 Tax=Segetibacter koreensis TaxID=398037 RepID=UPI00037EDE65|nr:DUF4249 domain-containing protein [Segetibacter koreensis]
MQTIYKKYISSLFTQLKRSAQLWLCHSLVPHQFYSTKNSNRFLLSRRVLSFSFISFAVYLTSCQKVINIGLNEAEKKYVVEAVLTDQPNSCKVLLTQTKNFSENNTFNGVVGAQVTIADNNAAPVTLTETSPGVYENKLTGVSGHTYTLTVKVAGQTFTSTSTMPALVPFDSLYISERTFFGETNKYATVSLKDPPGIGNAYRCVQYVNGVKEKTIFVRDDSYSDGRQMENTLYFFSNDDNDEKKLKAGDNVRIDLLSIDYPVYKYWFSLAQSSTGENQSATPGNPSTNIKGGALGYFSAQTLQSKTVAVK